MGISPARLSRSACSRVFAAPCETLETTPVVVVTFSRTANPTPCSSTNVTERRRVGADPGRRAGRGRGAHEHDGLALGLSQDGRRRACRRPAQQRRRLPGCVRRGSRGLCSAADAVHARRPVLPRRLHEHRRQSARPESPQDPESSHDLSHPPSSSRRRSTSTAFSPTRTETPLSAATTVSSRSSSSERAPAGRRRRQLFGLLIRLNLGKRWNQFHVHSSS